jgi:pimeloyl-ACP methyl ester carboxylesterase
MAVDLAFTDRGTGPAVVILHGLLGAGRNWATVAAALADRHRVITVDLRNHGESPWAEPHDYPALAEDVARLIDRQVGGPAAVVGHSMGGKAAMVLALDRPEVVEELVVVDIAPARSLNPAGDYVRAMRAVPLDTCASRADVEAALATAIPDAAMRRFLVLNLRSGPDGLRWPNNLEALDRHMDAILSFPVYPPGRTFTKPTLFVAGGRSHYLRPEHRPEIERLFPRVRFEVIDTAGHWVHADAPAAFIELVRTFLAHGADAPAG